jgi:hypothetical protein
METTFYAFQSNIRYFLNQLLKNPIDCKPNNFLTDRGFTKKKLINILLKRDVITRHEKIDDKDESNITYKIKYKVIRKNFERKLKRIYNKYFEKNEIDETTCCSTSSGAFVTALNQEPIRRNMKETIENKKQKRIFITEKQLELLKETLTTFNAGEYQYTVPFPVKKNDPTMKREKGLSMKRMK